MESGGYRAEGKKGEKKWDNCNSIINKIYLKPELFRNIYKDKTKWRLESGEGKMETTVFEQQ